MATTDLLTVPGAHLHVKMRGSGPVLLILPGGDGDADSPDAIAAQLPDYTVVTFDRRGLSRSTIDAPLPSPPPAGSPSIVTTHADDAQRVLASVTREPARVFGSSIGAVIGLELIARHPDSVKLLVAHEPPATDLLDGADREAARAEQRGVEDAFRDGGVQAAMARFGALVRIDFADREPGLAMPPPSPQRLVNLAFFLTHDAPAVRQHALDHARVIAAAARIVPGVSEAPRGNLAYRSAVALGALIHQPLVTFPGGHVGPMLRPVAFAAVLREVLAARA